MSSAGIYRAKWDRIRKAETSLAGMWSKAVLSAPYPDLAGDIVNPQGIDYRIHKADPSVDLEHGRDPSVRGFPVAWARESLDEPGAPYAVEFARLNFGGDGQLDDWQTVPVCTNYFDKSCRVSSQVFALVEQDALPAVSIEFRAVPGFAKALGRSPLEPRSAYHFAKADLIRWSICAKGVCPHALTLTKSAHLSTQVPPALGKILSDKRVNVGGKWEPLHGVILKALSTEPQPRRTIVRVEKSMDEYEDDGALDTQAETAVEDQLPEQAESACCGPTPTAQAAYNLSQGAKDLRAQVEADLKRGEHKPGRKKLAALLEKLDAISELAMSVGKQVDADTSDDDGEPDGDEGEAEEPEPEATPEDMEEDEDGVLKGIPPTFKKSVKRFKLADLTPAPAPVVQKAPEDDSPALRAKIAKLEKLIPFLTIPQ